MIWDQDAELAIRKVPFFVRKRVRKKVEVHAAQKGNKTVCLKDVIELKKKFISKGGMEKEIKGFEVSTCFGSSGCPHAAVPAKNLATEIEVIFEKEDILGFLKQHVKSDLKFHHEFRVALSDCPNACSRPQITDIGIIGAVRPGISNPPCTLCGKCEKICPEHAVVLLKKSGSKKITASEQTEKIGPIIDTAKCLDCAKCIHSCPSGTIKDSHLGFKVLLGGRLGRHPRLAMPVPGIKTHDQVLEIVKNCIFFYKTHSSAGQRFSQILSSVDQIVNLS